MISVLATVSKVAMLFTVSNCLGQLKWLWFKNSEPHDLNDKDVFDSASRRRLGAAELFLTSTRNPIASFGALLNIGDIGIVFK